MDKSSESKLEDILKQCTNRGNVPLSDKEKLFESLWKEQTERLSKHEKYLAESVEIYPIAEFVCKARIRKKDESIQESQKVFLNICSHHLIPNLSVSQIDVHQNGKTEQGIRFPMSSGPEIKVKDNKGNDASTYDVVFHPDIIGHAAKDHQYKMNICMTAAQNISQKHEVIIDGPFKFPKCTYKGIDINHKEPLPQRIRKKGAAKYVQDDGVIQNQCRDLPIEYSVDNNAKMSVIENQDDDVKVDDTENVSLHHDFYIVFVDEERNKLLIKDGTDGLKKYLMRYQDKEEVLKEIKAIQIHIDLTTKHKLSDLDLDTNEDGICLQCKRKKLFSLKWNHVLNGMAKVIDGDNVTAKFKKKKCLLKIYCPLL